MSIGAPTVLELMMVLSSKAPDYRLDSLMILLSDIGISIVPFTKAHSEIAIEPNMRFGKGRHPAKLNYGDCMTYAIAKLADMPLIFKGTDFDLTDVRPA